MIEPIIDKYSGIIFLDFDGVFNHDLFYKEKFADIEKVEGKTLYRTVRNMLIKKVKKEEISGFDYYKENQDPKVMSLINLLCKETNTAVVISASLRNGHDLNEIIEIFKYCGATFDIIDKTPYNSFERGTEISLWLKTNCEKWFGVPYFDFHRYMIIDDDSDMLLNQQYNFCKVDNYCGFTPTDYAFIRKFFTHKTF